LLLDIGALMPVVSASVLADNLRDLHLLTPEQMRELSRDLLPHFAEPKALAGELIRRGWLTPYQANLVLQGRGGELLLGSYVLLERIGEGGMGQVFKAQNWKLGRVVALKVIRKERLANDDAIRRFHREIRATAQLSHPNVVAAHDADEVHGTHFFAMEYVEGSDLAKLIKQHGQLPIAQACDWMRQAALGLQHAHERGLVHRDIKPHNLLLTKQGVVKVLDLGLAHLGEGGGDDEESSTLTQEGAVMGTLDYIAPEQIGDSHGVDIRADLYSLGCSLYQLLSGKVPFPGGKPIDKLYKHRHEQPTPLEMLRPDVPAAVAAVVYRLMAKRPEDRYATPAEAAVALAVTMPAGGAVTSVPVASLAVAVVAAETHSQSTGRTFELPANPGDDDGLEAWRRRRRGGRRWRIGLAAGAVLLAGAIVLVVWLSHSSRSNSTGPEQAVSQPTKKARREGEPIQVEVKPVEIEPEALKLAKGAPLSPATLVSRPPEIKGVRSWSIEPRMHSNQISAIAYSPDGRRLATASADWTVRIWDAETCLPLRVLLGHTGQVERLSWSPDGKYLASAGIYELRLWDAEIGRSLRRLWEQDAGFIRTMAWSPDGKTLAWAGDGPTVILWDAASGQRRTTFSHGHSKGVLDLSWSPDGKHLATVGADGPVRIWKAASGRSLRVLEGHEGAVRRVVWSPKGKELATAGADKTVRLWRVDGGELVQTFRGPVGDLSSLAWSPDGATLASGGWGEPIRLWKADSGEEVHTIQNPGGHVLSLAWSPDGRALAAGSLDGIVRLWNARSGVLRRSSPAPANWRSYTAWSPSGERFATGHGGLLVVRRADYGRVLWTLEYTGGNALAWKADGRLLAVGASDGALLLRNPDSGEEVGRWKGHTEGLHAVAWSPNGQGVATASADKTVRLWDAGTGQTRHVLQGHTEAVVSVAWSSDSRSVASGSHDGTVRLWDAASGKQARILRQGDFKLGQAVAWSPGGRTLAIAGRPSSRLWDVASGQLTQTLYPEAMTLAWSPDGKTLATGLSETELWDVKTGRQLHALMNQHPCTTVVSLAWSPDGASLLSGHSDGFAFLWDVKTGQRRAAFLAFSPDRHLTISPEGHYRGSPDIEKEIVYVALTEDGRQETLTPAEFAAKFGWKNDPDKASLADDAANGRR